MTDFIIIITTVGKQKEAKTIAKQLVTQQLAACVNILPGIQSTYCWKGSICEDEEVMMVIKTKTSHEKQVYQVIKSLHSYDLPELITLPIKNGYQPYLSWLNDSLSPT
jgi:periplasmic divalent cation tolerance protein